jgi:hypothetical protein
MTKPSRYGTVTVRTNRRDSSAIAGSQLILYTGPRPMAYAQTDGSGVFVFRNVPADNYGVRATPPSGYATIESLIDGNISDVIAGFDVSPGSNVPVQFNFLKIGAGQFLVRVLEGNGAPIVGLPLVLSTDSGVVGRATTDASGAHTFLNVPFGRYTIAASRPEQYPDGAGIGIESQDGLLSEDGSKDSTRLTFGPCTGSVLAQVTDDAGAPVPGAVLTFYGPNTLQHVTLGSTSSQVFSNVACAVYGVRVQPPAGYTVTEGFGTSYRDGLSVRRHSNVVAALTVNRIARGTIHVRVVDDIGTRLENVRVVLYTGAGTVSDVKSDNTGSITFAGLPITQQYGVRVVPRAGYTVREASGVSFFDDLVLTNGAVREIVFVLKRD